MVKCDTAIRAAEEVGRVLAVDFGNREDQPAGEGGPGWGNDGAGVSGGCAAKWFQKQIELTRTEFILVFQLARRPFVIFSRGQLLDICYPNDFEVEDRNIDSHIKRIRQKFKEVHPGKNFDRIHTSYGGGYSWRPHSVSA